MRSLVNRYNFIFEPIFLGHCFDLSICSLLWKYLWFAHSAMRALLAYRLAQDNVSTGPAGDYNLIACSKAQGTTVVSQRS